VRILIAEDDAILADGLTRSLRQAGCSVDCVKTGVEADTALATGQFDVLILDLGLSKMGGLDVLKRIRETSGLTQEELAKDVGVSQPAISYHISRMAMLGVLRVERRGRAKRYTANLGEAPGDVGPQGDPGDGPDFAPPDETDEWREA